MSRESKDLSAHLKHVGRGLMMDVEIITVGYEILEGDVLDTNSNWMAQRISKSGNRLRRVTIIEDNIDTIAQVLKDSLSRSPSMIIVSGGLGPTKDDLTLEGVAAGLGVGLAEDREALAMIAKAYEKWNPGLSYEELLTVPRRKMGVLPFGSIPLENPVGTAPGVLLEVQDVRVICLPGVPAELKGIFAESVLPLLAGGEAPPYTSVLIKGIGESDLAHDLNRAMEETGAEIRSYPSKGKIRLKIIGPNAQRAIEHLRTHLGEGIRVEELDRSE